MKEQVYKKERMWEMESMHDCKVSEIRLSGNVLTVVYDGLQEEYVRANGGYHRVTIRYYFDSYCRAFAFGRGKYVMMELSEFLKKYPDYQYCSYKYSVDNFQELTLDMSIFKFDGKKHRNTKWQGLYIELDPIKVVYTWEK